MDRRFFPVLCCAAIIASPVSLSAGDGDDEAAADAQSEITDKSHPDYVRCRTESVIGSRAKKRRVCLTNSEWAEVARQGHGMATALVEGGRAGIDWEARLENNKRLPCQQNFC